MSQNEMSPLLTEGGPITVEDRHFLDWINKEKNSPDRIEMEALQNRKSWIENAREMRTKEWNTLLEKMKGCPLWEDGAPDFNESFGQRQPALYEYPDPVDDTLRGAVIICPGGGFMFKSEWEAEPVARRFFEAGFRTFILDYRVQPYDRAVSGSDAIRAVRYLRYHADRFHVKSDKICMTGGSAGGLQTLMPSVCFDYGDPVAKDPVERVSSRVDAAIVWYGTFQFACVPMEPGGGFSFEKQNEKARMNAETLRLRPDCPPFFIWQTVNDDPRYLCRFGEALTDNGIPFEMHLFADAPHGCGLADGGHKYAPYARGTSRWSQMAIEFLENLEF